MGETHIDARRRSNELNARSRQPNEERVEAICKRQCSEFTSQCGRSNYTNVVEGVEDSFLHNWCPTTRLMRLESSSKLSLKPPRQLDNTCPWSARQQLRVPRMLSLSLLLSMTSRSVDTHHNLQHCTHGLNKTALAWRH